MPLPFDWHIIDPFPFDSAQSPIVWSPHLERLVMGVNADVWYSDNGIDWTIGTTVNATYGSGPRVWNQAQLAYYGYAYNPTASAYWSTKSTDGETWSYDAEITSSAVSFTGMAVNGAGQMIIITDDGHCYRGSGGGWTEAGADLITIDSSISTFWRVPIWHTSGNVWVVFNGGSVIDIPIATSSDAVTWTGRRGFNPTYQQDWVFATNYPSGMLAISENNGVIAISSDGVTWDYQTELTTEFPGLGIDVRGLLYSVDFGNFAVFNYDVLNDETLVFVSTSGLTTTWSQDSGVLPPYFNLGAVESHEWIGIFEAPELERFFGFANVLSLTPVVTSPGFNGNGGGGGDGDVLVEITGEGGLVLGEGADITIGWSYTGSGGLVIGDGGVPTPIVLSADVSGMYTLVRNQHFDRVYTRNINPDDTVDVAIPRPYGKTGYFGG